MIDVKELLYDIDLKLNKIGSNEHQNIELENKIIALNDAQINIVKTKFSENNLYKSGLDSFQKRVNDLEILIEKDQSLALFQSPTGLNNYYLGDLDNLSPQYMLGIPGSEYIIADKGDCKNHTLVVNQVKHGDIQTLLKNSNVSPSFEYQETIGTINKHIYCIYSDGSFTPKQLYISYIRYPIKVDFEGYYHFDGTPSTTVNSELPYYLKEEIVDVAVRALALSTENQNAVQASQLKISTNE